MCTVVTLDVNVFQNYGLDVKAFRELVTDCPERLLELSASCCMVGKDRSSLIKHTVAVQKQG